VYRKSQHTGWKGECKNSYIFTRGVGCGGSIASLQKCNKHISANFKKMFMLKKLINLRTYITCNENIASFNVLHKPFIRIYQLFSCWILAYETRLEAKPVVASIPFLLSLEFGEKTGFCLSGS
jgi:hypothetical protein